MKKLTTNTSAELTDLGLSRELHTEFQRFDLIINTKKAYQITGNAISEISSCLIESGGLKPVPYLSNMRSKCSHCKTTIENFECYCSKWMEENNSLTHLEWKFEPEFVYAFSSVELGQLLPHYYAAFKAYDKRQRDMRAYVCQNIRDLTPVDYHEYYDSEVKAKARRLIKLLKEGHEDLRHLIGTKRYEAATA